MKVKSNKQYNAIQFTGNNLTDIAEFLEPSNFRIKNFSDGIMNLENMANKIRYVRIQEWLVLHRPSNIDIYSDEDFCLKFSFI